MLQYLKLSIYPQTSDRVLEFIPNTTKHSTLKLQVLSDSSMVMPTVGSQLDEKESDRMEE